MALRKSPLLNTNTDKIEKERIYETNSENFMMAVSARRIQFGASYFSDPRYVRWYATFVT